MSLIAPLILMTALTMPTRSPAGNEQDAMKALAKATYKQTNLDDKVKVLEKKLLSKEVRIYGSWATTIVKIHLEKRVTYEWTF